MKKYLLLFLTALLVTILVPVKSFAQELDLTTSSTKINEEPATFNEAAVPSVTCFETSSSSGTCSIGSNGLQEVCSSPGCYDRAKFLINSQNNPEDTKYAVEISTSSTFASDNFYVDAATRLLKSTLTINDFIYKCDWEGTISAGFCESSNTTWQKYNILGLNPDTTYYLRIAALHGSTTDGSFTQTDWSTISSASTQNTSLSIDVDIASSTAGSSSPPFIINLGNMTSNEVSTTTNYVIFRMTTNAISGVELQIKGTNGGLLNGTSLIANVNADLATNVGYGLRNDATTNSSSFSSFIGAITVTSTPSDFTDAGAINKVGSPTTSFVNLFTSNSLPLDAGVSGYRVKAKPDLSKEPGNYSETLTYIPVASF